MVDNSKRTIEHMRKALPLLIAYEKLITDNYSMSGLINQIIPSNATG
jgi:hypothetical protein